MTPEMGEAQMAKQPAYDQIVREIFKQHHKKGSQAFEFARTEIRKVAAELGIDLPKNLGDLIYSYRFRRPLPPEIAGTAPEGKEWIIELAGQARYRFRLSSTNRITPRPDLLATKIPDATPEIISRYTLSDEQALLAKVRYNRLIDIFLGITTYSLQNHLRTTVSGMGQIEADEIYVGVNRHGTQFVIPVQAKGGPDQIGGVQAAQDFACCREKFPELVCRAVAAQFLKGDVIAMFELTMQNGEVRVLDERHYQLVPSDAITPADLSLYKNTRQ